MRGLVRDYADFLDRNRTEREVAGWIASEARSLGFSRLADLDRLEPGDRVLFGPLRGTVFLAVLGDCYPAECGFRVAAAHTDSVRIDLKYHPLGERRGVAFFRTRYYGSIKPYQWVHIPLILRGVVGLRGGETVEVSIGGEGGPFLVIPDLFPHVASTKQGERRGLDVVRGEELRPLVGLRPGGGAAEGVVRLLREEYGIGLDDLASAELELVPAFHPAPVGLDGSMLGAYGQDDRYCVFSLFKAISRVEDPTETSVVALVDREETGSEGEGGAQSATLELFLSSIMGKGAGIADLLCALSRSIAVSADTPGAWDPVHGDVHDPENVPRLGLGPVIRRFTGKGGKFGTSEASAEYSGWIRGILTRRDIPHQFGNYGTVDAGGGGTVARFLARRGMQVIDLGLPVIGIHSPYEISAPEFDLDPGVAAYEAFFSAPRGGEVTPSFF